MSDVFEQGLLFKKYLIFLVYTPKLKKQVPFFKKLQIYYIAVIREETTKN